MKVWLVDTFTTEIFTGNPASVVVVQDFFDDATSIKIASELKQVETAFVKILSEGHCHIRWFTPTREVKMCGHATVAAAHVLWEEKLIKGSRLVFESLSGMLPTERAAEGISLELPLQQIGESISDERFSQILNTPPLSIVSVGGDILVEVADASTVKLLDFDISKLLAFDCRAVIVTAQGDNGYDFTSRLFAPSIGIPEDAVSAASHCKIAEFWRQKTGKTHFKAFQASKRGGELSVVIGDKSVFVCGKAVTAMKGDLG